MRDKIGRFTKGHKGFKAWKDKRFTNEHKLKLSISHFKSGKSKNDGYIRATRTSGGKYEHRKVMEEYLGRKLLKVEVVHHKNGIKTDNRITNLKLLPNQSLHMKLHRNK